MKNDRLAWLQGPGADGAAKCSNVPKSARTVATDSFGSAGRRQRDAGGIPERAFVCLSSFDRRRLSSGGQAKRLRSIPGDEGGDAIYAPGELVPDATVWEMVRERSHCLLHCNGFILDGFPRTLGQAESLKELMEKEKLSLTAVVNYELPLNEIVRRLSGRRTCENARQSSTLPNARRKLSPSAITAEDGFFSGKTTVPSRLLCDWKHTNGVPRPSSSSIRISGCCCRLLPRERPMRSRREPWTKLDRLSAGAA